MVEEKIKSESLRKALIKAMRKLDRKVRVSSLEQDVEWLFVITMLTASGYLKTSDREAILKR